ncbi:Succinate-semialdehyde dehydrogenase [NADP(+)] GabD [Cyphellophora attinorum]|uniref:Succinate-semialdehyde dehydrogenase, mitochondrial n=1 Tax=Cyphellophora attinorum TaxID=1664694 RepID=A0A0N0NIY2_9EURO|nr:Succinate-semialdehyde dehydrogenase [NADP(+)] GabD [Phialophora attinorum]KPI36278.1 Succinate-semialdehyde dehydrogenase [NADP(+)] GabD [Phialophora attinorum]
MGSVSTPLRISRKLQNAGLFVTEGLISGQWRPGKSGETFSVIEPSSGEELSRCANLALLDFKEAIDSAHTGYQNFYTSTTAKERGTILRGWNELIIKNADDLATILSLENGKTLAEAKGEVLYAASFVAWFAEEAARSYGDTIPSSYNNTVVLTLKEPVGVCGIITPWNFPAAMITRKIAPALAAGCSVVIKPPSETPFSALALAKLALEAGVPGSCLHVVPTKDREASLELAVSPKVMKLSFTALPIMELGGNAPVIVFKNADLDLAVDGAMISKFRATGQTCVCANRLYVHSSIVDEFTTRLVDRVKALKLGRGIDEGTTQGPLVNAAAVAKVDEHVRDATDKGAKILVGGKSPSHLNGFFYEPTVIVGATSDMKVAREETFGPLAAIFPFESEDEVIGLANDTEFGLAGYFFSKDIGQVMRVAQAMQCGMVGVNTGLISAAESPFGGIKESGVGREGSKYGLAEFQNIKSITIGNLDK